MKQPRKLRPNTEATTMSQPIRNLWAILDLTSQISLKVMFYSENNLGE